MGTWPVLAIPFPPCLSRKRQSWEHGVCLRFPFPPSCRGNDNHGNTPCACETLFPLPDKEKAVVGCLRFAFPFACRRKGFPRDSAGLRGWGAHGAPQGPEGLRGALQGFVAWNCLSFDRQGEMAITGTLGGVEHFEASGGAFSSTGRGKRVGAPQGQNPPWRQCSEHVEASGCVFS